MKCAVSAACGLGPPHPTPTRPDFPADQSLMGVRPLCSESSSRGQPLLCHPISFTVLCALFCLLGSRLFPALLSSCLLSPFLLALFSLRRWKNSRALKGSLVQNYKLFTSGPDIWAVQQTHP